MFISMVAMGTIVAYYALKLAKMGETQVLFVYANFLYVFVCLCPVHTNEYPLPSNPSRLSGIHLVVHKTSTKHSCPIKTSTDLIFVKFKINS